VRRHLDEHGVTVEDVVDRQHDRSQVVAVGDPTDLVTAEKLEALGSAQFLEMAGEPMF
jgi:hypothetical protein